MTADELLDLIDAHRPTWWDHAACRGEGTERFFHDGAGRRSHVEIEATKTVCAGCPVAGDCRAHAEEFDEPFGMWAGETPDERRHRLVGRRVGAPRKMTSRRPAANARDWAAAGAVPVDLTDRECDHGSHTAYATGCRCATCVAEMSEYMTRRRDFERAHPGVEHGTDDARQTGCRCRKCATVVPDIRFDVEPWREDAAWWAVDDSEWGPWLS